MTTWKWFEKRMNSEEKEYASICDKTWIIYFEEYPYVPIFCRDVKHAIEVYDKCVQKINDGWLTFSQACAEESILECELTPVDMAEFLLATCGICGIPFSFTDEEFWKDILGTGHPLIELL